MTNDRYFVNDEEVTKEEYISAERRNGFHSKGGPNKIATASWSSTRTGESGRVDYGRPE